MEKNHRFIKFIFATDLHGDMGEPSVVAKLLEFKKQYNPDLTVFGGDLWDFRCLRGKANDKEKHDSLLKDYYSGLEFLNNFHPDIFLRGNHDERLWDLAEGIGGVATDFAIQGVKEIEKICKELNTKILPYDKRLGVVRLGKLKMLHGFVCGLNAVRTHAASYGACLIGHVHTIEACSVPRDQFTVARSVGCLCRLDMQYNRSNLTSLRQQHGWAFGLVDRSTGNFWVQQAYSVGGKWVCPTDFVEL